MGTKPRIYLDQKVLSLNHQALSKLLIEKENILIIQDLDGVCMGLVKDPLTRTIDPRYVEATKLLNSHFYVLTNGEHIGKRGVNKIIERAYQNPDLVKEKGLYLPGLAGGGVQWQDRFGNVSHLGVSEAELNFLAEVPAIIANFFRQILAREPYNLDSQKIEELIAGTVLDNKVSPTANISLLHEQFLQQPHCYIALQKELENLMEKILNEAEKKGLGNSFFVHYAPNLGKNNQREILKLAQGKDSGTTDFQFMLRGAVKEVGVLVILNYYYYQKTGNYPLGKDFNVRQVSQEHDKLLEIIKTNFAPAIMPTIIGVGDTVTSQAEEINGQIQFKRGGSDRGFLQLIQELNRDFKQGNIIVYVDSSQGEVKNRVAVKLETYTEEKNGIFQEKTRVIQGPCDARDTQDPLTLNIVFPGGYQQYKEFFIETVNQRQSQ